MESTRQRICFREVRLEEKDKAKAKADTCQLVLDRSHLYHAGAGLERWRSSLRITDAIVHLTCTVYNCANIVFASVIVNAHRNIDP
ncbi:hypothetical protein ARMGADRAFT_174891 [Armillaria gallica]|uniref:Uncharacterized protein n=1 Tax=Armillaria gallica TaxID=47427 RepID=A0A2H3CVB8_ARMGA|nr:hypothetical protein ARMGADRAFT_174891 [Armillaria gallica]